MARFHWFVKVFWPITYPNLATLLFSLIDSLPSALNSSFSHLSVLFRSPLRPSPSLPPNPLTLTNPLTMPASFSRSSYLSENGELLNISFNDTTPRFQGREETFFQKGILQLYVALKSASKGLIKNICRSSKKGSYREVEAIRSKYGIPVFRIILDSYPGRDILALHFCERFAQVRIRRIFWHPA